MGKRPPIDPPEELTPGQVAAKVFAFLDAGEKNLRPIVRRLQLDPDLVDRLYAAWADPDLAAKHSRRKIREREEDDAEIFERQLRRMDRDSQAWAEVEAKKREWVERMRSRIGGRVDSASRPAPAPNETKEELGQLRPDLVRR
jgi:hypothetical protein